MRKRLSLASPLVAVLLAAPFLAACTDNPDSGDGDGDGGSDARALSVESSADACDVSAAEAPAGTLTFDVTNTGTEVTEFYLLGEDGLRIVAEVENIGPSLNRELTVNAPAGSYITACKPGMTGEGIRADFTVTESDQEPVIDADDQALVDQAPPTTRRTSRTSPRSCSRRPPSSSSSTSPVTTTPPGPCTPPARMHWERIETVAESFGDLDPMMDAREADLEEGDEFTGWHRIEKDLWPARAEDYTALTDEERAFYADDLLANTTELDARVQELTYTIDQIANGSRGLLEEVATGKVTGEEEYWSRTDLWDFQANVDGAKVAFEGVQPIVEAKDPELADRAGDPVRGAADAARRRSGWATGSSTTTS